MKKKEKKTHYLLSTISNPPPPPQVQSGVDAKGRDLTGLECDTVDEIEALVERFECDDMRSRKESASEAAAEKSFEDLYIVRWGGGRGEEVAGVGGPLSMWGCWFVSSGGWGRVSMLWIWLPGKLFHFVCVCLYACVWVREHVCVGV